MKKTMKVEDGTPQLSSTLEGELKQQQQQQHGMNNSTNNGSDNNLSGSFSDPYSEATKHRQLIETLMAMKIEKIKELAAKGTSGSSTNPSRIIIATSHQLVCFLAIVD